MTLKALFGRAAQPALAIEAGQAVRVTATHTGSSSAQVSAATPINPDQARRVSSQGSVPIKARGPLRSLASLRQIAPDQMVKDRLSSYLLEQEYYLKDVLEHCGLSAVDLPKGIKNLKDLVAFLEKKQPGLLKRIYESLIPELSAISKYEYCILPITASVAGLVAAAVGLVTNTVQVAIIAVVVGIVLTAIATGPKLGKQPRIFFNTSYGFLTAGIMADLKMAEVASFGDISMPMIAGLSLLASIAAYLSPLPKVALRSFKEQRLATKENHDLLTVLSMANSDSIQRAYLSEHSEVVTGFLQDELPKTLQTGIDPIREELDRLRSIQSQLQAKLASLERLYPDPTQRELKRVEITSSIPPS